MPKTSGKSGQPSQRQLKVGEEIRHALSQIFLRDELHESALEGISITVSEVRISPDLKNATAFVSALSGMQSAELASILNEHTGELRHLMVQRVYLRHAPRLSFKQDESFDEAMKINQLLDGVNDSV